MKSIVKTGCWTAAIAAGFLFFGAPSVQAQFRATTGTQPAAKTGSVNPNLLRTNFTRPVRQPIQAMKVNNNGLYQGMNQQGFNPYGMNPYGMMNQGGYPGMMYPGMMNQGYPGMMYPGYYPY